MQSKAHNKAIVALATGDDIERLSSESRNINERRDRTREQVAELRVEGVEFRRMLIKMPVIPEVLCGERRYQQEKANNLAQRLGDVSPRCPRLGGNLDRLSLDRRELE